LNNARFFPKFPHLNYFFSRPDGGSESGGFDWFELIGRVLKK